MIEIRVKDAANKAGITSGYQLDKAAGFGPGMSQRIFEGDFRRIDLNTLNTLCNVLHCTPNDILRFTPDQD
jgi:DNA-binding Xre family transcriptional regulator